MSLSLAPEALIAQFFVRPVPRTIDGGLDAANVPGVECGCGGREVMGDVAAKTVVGICTRQTASRLEESKSLVRELFVHFCDLTGAMDNPCLCCSMTDDLRADGVVPFLLHSPIHALRMCLVVREEEFLAAVQSGTRMFISAGVEVLGVYQTAPSSSA